MVEGSTDRDRDRSAGSALICVARQLDDRLMRVGGARISTGPQQMSCSSITHVRTSDDAPLIQTSYRRSMHEATRIETRHLHDDDGRAGPGLVAWIVGAIAVEFLGLIALVAHVS